MYICKHYVVITYLLENEIDGDTFCDLRQDELERMIPNKLGVVKKLLKVYKYPPNT